MSKVESFLGGSWRPWHGRSTSLHDPVTGDEIAQVTAEPCDIALGLAYARDVGGPALRSLTYADRAALLGRIAEVLTANRAKYFEIALRNSGSPKSDASIDIDGAIFTLKYFSKAAASLGSAQLLCDGGLIRLGKDESFQSQHILVPTKGAAVLINAFNFPSWGLWEKAAPALLSGVPVVAKPATSTAWLTHEMVADVVKAQVLPAGALSLICGPATGLLDNLYAADVVAFTGSADTATRIRTHQNVLKHSIRVNAEADSINSALLGPDATAESPEFDLFVTEVVREMTVKAGQKCTAIRRAFVPAKLMDAAANGIADRLSKIVVGNPRNPSVQMGPLVSADQLKAAVSGLVALRAEARVVTESKGGSLIDASSEVGAFIFPTLLRCDAPEDAGRVHDVEVFGPVATLMPYENEKQLFNLVRRGQGSLVASIFSADPAFVGTAIGELADSHGRLLVVDASVGKTQTGHGNVMPMCLHGGPGRAGGGEELGGLRALNLYHRRSAIQGPVARVQDLATNGTPFTA